MALPRKHGAASRRFSAIAEPIDQPGFSNLTALHQYSQSVIDAKSSTIQNEFICHHLSSCVTAARRYFARRGARQDTNVAKGLEAQQTGVIMFGRIATIVTLSVSLTACAQSPLLVAPSFNTGSLQAAATASTTEPSAQISYLGKPTMAGKVLTAIALERVTGLKPDPSAFSEFD